VIQKLRKSWLNTLLLLAILLALVFVVDLPAVLQAVITIHPLSLVAVLLLATADRFLMGMKWRHLLQAAGWPVDFRRAVSAYYQSGLSSRLIPVPISSEVLRGHLIARTGIPAAVVFSSMVVEKLIAWLASSLLGLASLVFLLSSFQEDTAGMLLLGTSLAVAFGGLALGLILYRPAHHLGSRIFEKFLPSRLNSLYTKISQAVLQYRSRPSALAVNLLLAFVEQGIQFTKFYVLGRALGISLPALSFFAVIGLTVVVRRVTSYIEGWGLGEASTVVMFALLGVDQETAVAFSFLNYTTTVVASLPGAYLLYRSGASLQGLLTRTREAGLREEA